VPREGFDAADSKRGQKMGSDFAVPIFVNQGHLALVSAYLNSSVAGGKGFQ
jgi:hypothetical protein